MRSERLSERKWTRGSRRPPRTRSTGRALGARSFDRGPRRCARRLTPPIASVETERRRIARQPTPMREFVDETPVARLVIRVSHLLTPLPAGRLQINYSAEIDGP